MPVGTELKHVDLKPGERVRVEYGTTMTRINYREIHCGKSGNYDLTSNYKQTSAPSGEMLLQAWKDSRTSRGTRLGF